jgi:hypothetical protein
LLKFFIAILLASLNWQAQAGEPTLPALTALFRTTQCAVPCRQAVTRDWWMLRASDRVELRDTVSDQLASYGEIWKQTQGKLKYVYLMHDDKRAIEYQTVDLSMLGVATDLKKWQLLTQLISSDELASLRPSHKKTPLYHGMQTQQYTGELQQAKVKLLWIPQLAIPLSLEYRYPKSKVTINLRALSRNTPTRLAIPQTTTDDMLEHYQRLDYTDIGDMEQNEEVKLWLANVHGAPGLHSHTHP